MDNYNFKVIAELRSDLSGREREVALSQIADLQIKFGIVKVGEKTYCKAGTVGSCDDFGAVTFFFCKLKRIKFFFAKLEYYDLWGEEKKVAV